MRDVERHTNASRGLCTPLSDAEVRVIKEIIKHPSRRDTAKTLGMSELTVKSHLGHIYARLGVTDVVGMIAVAFAIGVIDKDDVGQAVTTAPMDDLQSVNVYWLPPELQMTVRQGPRKVVDTAKTASYTKVGTIELNGVCVVRLNNIRVKRFQRVGSNDVIVKLIGGVHGSHPELRRHLGKAWLSRIVINRVSVLAGHQVTASTDVDVDGRSPRQTYLSLTWVEEAGVKTR